MENIRILDGAVIYQTNFDVDHIKKIRYFNNTFIVIREFNYNSSPTVEILNKVISDLLDNRGNFDVPITSTKSFKIFFSLENVLVKPDGKLMYHLVELIKKKTRKNYNSNFADTEFWILYRSEMMGFFMLRITKKKKKLDKGELRPELTNLLCRLSVPRENDVFLDPFCGSGAIPLERSRTADFKGIFASDRDANLVKELKNRIKKMKASRVQKSFFIKNLDFFNNTFDDNFFDTIVTDPPWGIYEKVDKNFYPNFLKNSYRILKPEGKLILLSAGKEYFTKESITGNFVLETSFDILVSGEKSGSLFINKKVTS
ncbi:MAG: RsmD family RNA methyltransferase [Rickettsiales bacterium]|nr:RsmD family RNA methyltransferase [Rickettsiales bacterium]